MGEPSLESWSFLIGDWGGVTIENVLDEGKIISKETYDYFPSTSEGFIIKIVYNFLIAEIYLFQTIWRDDVTTTQLNFYVILLSYFFFSHVQVP
ncbi:MAG: hypothetical protein ACW99Q_21975 [Candidatus Kariarchaeaceae archaeon]|jgi:hypothetical protein